jgi:polar amino acid transport system substrate-binding protein
MLARQTLLRVLAGWAGAALLLAGLLPSALAAPTVVRLSNGEWPPFMSAARPGGGVVTQIVTEAFAQEGIKAEYEYLPWKRALSDAANGRLAGSVGWSRTAEREPLFYYSQPILEAPELLFHLKTQALPWRTMDDLYKKTIGGGLGYYYGDEFENAEKAGRIHVERVVNDEQNLHKLLAGRIDAAVINVHVGYDLLATRFSTADAARIVADGRPVRVGQWHLILSRKLAGNQQLMASFNRGLAKLRGSGRLAQLMRGLEEGR